MSEEKDIYNFESKDVPDEEQLDDLGGSEEEEEGKEEDGGEEMESVFKETKLKRPMTSTDKAGYHEGHKKKGGIFALGGKAGKGSHVLKRRSENSAAFKSLEMERLTNAHYEESARLYVEGYKDKAQMEAQKAVKKERELTKFQEENSIQEHNFELTFAVAYNLAHMNYVRGQYVDAESALMQIVSQKSFIDIGGGRLRVNMGNIKYEKAEYDKAIIEYRKALDPINPTDHKDIRARIGCNIGMAFVKDHSYTRAAEQFENAYEVGGSIYAMYNSILCYYAVNRRKMMKKNFMILLDSRIPGYGGEEFGAEEDDDDLSKYFRKKRDEFYDLILKVARLIADRIEDNWEKGYDFLISKLKQFQVHNPTCNLSSEMEMEKALKYLKVKSFKKAILALKAFEKGGEKLAAIAYTNLSYIYILEDKWKDALTNANAAIQLNPRNSKALVNQGICLFHEKKYPEAQKVFNKARHYEPFCVEALYNMALVDKIQEKFKDALEKFKTIFRTLLPDSIEVMYQIADTYEKMDDFSNAKDFFNQLLGRISSGVDPSVFFLLGQIFEKENDDQSFSCFVESDKYYPVNIQVVQKLGNYFVKNDMYEKALEYWTKASQIEPKNVRWKLYVASCLRKIGQSRSAYTLYKKILKSFPENLECLKYLITLCGDLGMEQEKLHYLDVHAKLEKKLEKKISLKKTLQVEKEVDDDSMTRQMDEEERKTTEAQKSHKSNIKKRTNEINRGFQEHTTKRKKQVADDSGLDDLTDDVDMGELLGDMF